MKLSRKTNTAIIALILILTISSLTILTTVSAQEIQENISYIYVCTTPVAGVGQQMFIITWTQDMPPDVGETSQGIRASWSGITLEITAPDQTKQTIEMGDTDPVGGGYYLYTPTQVGEYTVQATFPGQWKNTTAWERYYTPAISLPSTFTVQEDPVPGWPEVPPTTDYWMRPVAGPTHWNSIVGSWLGDYAQTLPTGAYGGVTNRYGYGSAPGSAHILWTRTHYPSGSITDQRFGNEVATLNHYQDVNFDGANLILDGKIHLTPQYTAHWGDGNAVGEFGWEIWDLYTGEQLFFDPYAIKPDFGQIYLYNSPNQHGTFTYLWRTNDVNLPETVTREPQGQPNETITLTTIPGTQTWEMIDAYTLNRVCFVANITTSGTTVYGHDGSYLKYRTVNLGDRTNPNYYLQLWNMSAIRTMLAGDYASGTQYWQWRPQWGGHSNYQYRWRENVNAFHDWNDQNFFLNVSIPVTGGSILAVREGEYVIIGDGGFNNDDETRDAWFTAFSLEQGHEGDMLWQSSFTPPYAFEWGAGFSSGMALGDVFPEEEVVLYNNRVELKYVAHDLRTGAKLWEWDDPIQYGYYGLNYNSYNGMLLASNDYSGQMTAIDLRTGDIVWEYKAGGGGTESPWGSAIWRDEMVADGKIYMTAWEHSASTPLWRGENLRCIDAETGEELWKFTLWGGGSSELATADGILIGFNWYDGQVYAFGRGPSATTVTAPDVAVPLGTPVMLKGTVTDQTPTGKRNINNDLQFSLKGTPAISDEDMAEWMEYIFMGQAFPMNAKGVTVNLWSIDPNGNFQDLGQTTSDSTGAFGMNWVPPVPGQYQLTASFDGSESYGPSSATTYFYVDEAPSPGASMEPELTTPELTTPELTTPELTTPEPTEPAEAPLITTEIAIVAVVAVACVIGVVSFWALRKRK